MKPYILLLENLRRNATNDFDKDLFKLMANSFFGKTMENVRNRFDVKVVYNEKQFLRNTIKPRFKGNTKRITDNLVLQHLEKKTITLNKPIYLGISILDLSKLHMLEFHYDVMKKKYGDKLSLLFTKILIEFIGLQPKMYSFITEDMKRKKASKGIKLSTSRSAFCLAV